MQAEFKVKHRGGSKALTKRQLTSCGGAVKLHVKSFFS